jgi:glycosyltransferase involved in cell wall biosynthesis
MTPSFSVIIAAYEAAATIGDAVRSALEQVPPPMEIIVGDDESTDDLPAALAPFGDSVRVVRIEHGGEAAAKNAAAAVARGDFLAFLDADDRFLPGRLAAIAALLEREPDLDAVTTDALLVHGDTVIGRCYGPDHPFEADDQRRAILERNFVLGLAAVRRERFAAVGGFDVTISHTTDWDLWIRLIHTGSRIGFLADALAEYRVHDKSMSANRAAMARGRLETIARAEARGGLDADEQTTLERARRRWETERDREELNEALRIGTTPDVRRAAKRVARSRDHRAPTRVKAGATVLFPRLAAALLRRRERRTFATVGGRRLSRS